MPLHLVPVSDAAQAVPLDKAVIFFGRHPDCDIVITSSRRVSRKHCCIAQIDDAYVIRDLGSMNGVTVNGKLIREATRITLGDEVSVGDVRFRVAQAAPRTANGKQQPRVGSRPAPQPAVPVHMISQDIPVVIPEQGASFAVEESAAKKAAPPGPGDTDEPAIPGKNDVHPDDESEFEIEVLD